MCIWQQIYSLFWSSSLWLPKNTTWADVAPGSRPNINYANCRDLLWSLPMAILLFTIRHCCEKYIFSPIGQSLGIKNIRSSSKRTMPNQILEQAYIKCSRLDERTLLGLTKQVDTMTQREIERWWRLRQAQDRPTPIRKFSESLWRCLYYTCSFSLGLFVLWDKPWLWDVNQCWLDHPHHSLVTGTWFYIMISLSLYLTQIVSQFVDVKRKDFWMVFVHHIATILAISLSWIGHFHRMGSLVLLCHDFSDIFLEATKIAIYTKYQKFCDFIAVTFLVIWIITRLIVYPQLVYSTAVATIGFISMVLHILVCLLLILQCLHILWTFIIFKVVYIAWKSGRVQNDCRSSSESSDSGS